MKRTTKKLELKRKKVVELTQDQLENVSGGNDPGMIGGPIKDKSLRLSTCCL